MAKKEKNGGLKLSQIIVHPNRWLAWTVCVALMFCIALVGFIKVSDVNFEAKMWPDFYSKHQWPSFTHKSEGYTLRYPKYWGVESEGSTGMNFVNLQNSNEYFSVTQYQASEEREVRASLSQTKEKEVSFNGISGVKLTGQPDSAVLVRDGGNLFVLRGQTKYFDLIVASFRLSEKLSN